MTTLHAKERKGIYFGREANFAANCAEKSGLRLGASVLTLPLGALLVTEDLPLLDVDFGLGGAFSDFAISFFNAFSFLMVGFTFTCFSLAAGCDFWLFFLHDPKGLPTIDPVFFRVDIALDGDPIGDGFFSLRERADLERFFPFPSASSATSGAFPSCANHIELEWIRRHTMMYTNQDVEIPGIVCVEIPSQAL